MTSWSTRSGYWPLTRRDYWGASTYMGYSWPAVRKALRIVGVDLAAMQHANARDPRSDTDLNIKEQIQQWRKQAGDSIPAAADTADCMNGIGALLRGRNQNRRGRDVQLACKMLTCEVCGPKNREMKRVGILAAFAHESLHANVMDDDEEAWDTVRKYISRKGAGYFRVPAPECKFVVFTPADVGELVESGRYDVVQGVVDLQPCDGRRMTSNREWKGVAAPRTTDWERVGISAKPQADRIAVYEEEGLIPHEAGSLHEDVVRAYEISLPPEDSPEMRRVRDRAGIFEPISDSKGVREWVRQGRRTTS